MGTEDDPETVQRELRGTRKALLEALCALYVYDKSPPYTVPYAIMSDLWIFRTVATYALAMKVLKNAVAQSK